MNTSETESLLRRAPCPAPPQGLRDRLIEQGTSANASRLTTVGSPAGATSRATEIVGAGGAGAWIRRWWTALVPAAATLICMGIVAAQQVQIRELQKIPSGLVSAPVASSHAAPNSSPAETPGPQASPDIDAEIQRLKNVVARYNEEIALLENAQLSRRNAAAAAAPGQDVFTPEELAPLEVARAKAHRIQCANNMKQIGLAVRIWAGDNGDVTPPDVFSVSKELGSPKVLFCPADTGRQPVTEWADLSTAGWSYEYLAPSAPVDREMNRVLARCPIHENVCLLDGSVFMARAGQLETRDGKLFLAPTKSGDSGVQSPNSESGTRTADQEAARARFRQRYGLPPEPTPAP